MKNNNICCIFNYGSHYRSSIYQLMDKEFQCNFYLGDKLPGDIKKMDYNSLSGYRKSLKNIKLIGNFYWQVGAIKAVFESNKHIIMNGEPYCISNWAILIFAKILGKKTYTWTHAWYGKETVIKRIIKKCFYKLSHHILLYGNYAKSLMLKEGFAPEKISCIYNSLNYDEQLTFRKELKATNIYVERFNNHNPTLIFIGRLTRVKRLDLLLNALSILKKNSWNFNLTIIGVGEMKEDLLIRAKELELEQNIWFYGACFDEKKLSELIYNAEICISPGNVGLTAMHSLSYGTPVITHDKFEYQMPEFEAITNNKTGLFFEYDNYKSLSDKIVQWCSLKIDRNQIRNSCYSIIDLKYNPYYQINLLKKVIK